ncbi:hypothetical protein DFAR_2500004 [Desulfarculales bacterium]
MPGTTWSVVNGRGYCGISAPSGGEFPSPTAPGCRAPTILEWVRLYRQGGGKLESLYSMGRNDRDGSRALDEDTASRPGPPAQGTAHCVSD